MPKEPPRKTQTRFDPIRHEAKIYETIDKLNEYAAAETQRLKPAPVFVDRKFKEQTDFIEDESRLKCVICTRRSGKSYGAGLLLYEKAYKNPGCSVLYIALTRDSAKKILWKDVLKPINRNLDIGAEFNESLLTVTLPNGSIIYSLGVDSTEDEKRKLLGQKYALVVIDEAAQYTIDLNELVYGILKPAVADYRGTICLLGSPSNLKKGMYFELTANQDSMKPGRWEKNGWSCHRWSAFQNPYMAKKWQSEIDDLEKANPRIKETPLFQQHYLGRWVVDDSKLVYRYQPTRNEFNGELPAFTKGEWHYVLGVDLGYEDPTAFVVGAYHDHCKDLLILEATKESGLDVTSVAERIKKLQNSYDFERIIIDNSSKQAVAELEHRHGIPLTAADKKGKPDFIEIMNGEFIQGRIKLGPKCEPLKEEYPTLIWDDRSDKRQEHPGCENHNADACLYLWRYCLPYLSEAIETKPQPGSRESIDEEEREMEDRQLGRLRDRRASEETGGSSSDNWDPIFLS